MIQRKGPDGKVYQFKDGTSEQEMSSAFSSVYNKPKREPYVASETPYGEIGDDLTATSQSAIDNASKVMDRNKVELGSALGDKEGTGVSPANSLFSPRGGINRSGMSSPQYGTDQEANVPQDARPQNLQELSALNVAEGVIPASIEILGGTVSAAAKVLSNITPDVIENPTVNTAIEVGEAIMNSPLMEKGIELVKENYPKYLTWAKENPFYDRAIKATFNMTALATKTPVSKLDDVGIALSKSGNKSAFKNRVSQVETLLEPIHPETSDMTNKMTPTETVGILNRIVPVYTDNAKSVIDTVAKVKGLNPKGSFSEGRNTIYKEITSTADQLRVNIRKAGNPEIDTANVATRLQDAADNLKESTGYSLAGGTDKFADDLMNTAIRFVKGSDGTVEGLLDARQKLDGYIKKHQPSSLTQEYINSKSKAVGEIRSLMNQTVIDAVPSVDVEGLLAKQHKLYQAWDVVGDKAVNEGRNAISRTFDTVVKNKVSMPSTPMSLYYTASGAGYWAVSGNGLFTLGALGGVAGTVVGAKVLSGPKVRQSLGWLLQGISKTLKKTKVIATIETLKADRLIIVGLLNDLEEDAKRPPLLSASN